MLAVLTPHAVRLANRDDPPQRHPAGVASLLVSPSVGSPLYQVGRQASRSMRPRICPERLRVKWPSVSCTEIISFWFRAIRQPSARTGRMSGQSWHRRFCPSIVGGPVPGRPARRRRPPPAQLIQLVRAKLLALATKAILSWRQFRCATGLGVRRRTRTRPALRGPSLSTGSGDKTDC